MECGAHVVVAADQRMFAEALVTALGQTGITGSAVTGMADARRVTELGGADLVVGWVPRQSPMPHLCNVINGVLQGETWIPPALLTTVVADLTCTLREAEEEAQRPATLTAREREILSVLCTGTPRSAIASQLFLSPNTVRTHIQNLIQNLTGKLGVHSFLAAVAVARRMGLPDSSC